MLTLLTEIMVFSVVAEVLRRSQRIHWALGQAMIIGCERSAGEGAYLQITGKNV
jgi:L-cystine uptake protein TcyP (sodium:dicarboxylate symporter family)